MHAFSFREPHGIRAFWDFTHPNQLSLEFYWWSSSCGISADVSDEDWTFHLAFPPFSLFFSIAGFGLWKPQEKHIFHWDNNREVWLTDARACSLRIFDWSIWIQPWSRSMEWRASDPWWVRGVTLDLRKLLGREQYTCETLRDGIPVIVPMPEGVYHGTAKIERRTWKRPLWFRQTRGSTTIDCPKGIPHAGKGENSWDCGDDGLFGWGVEGDAVEKAIAHGVATVLIARRRYGQPSQEALTEALA